MQDSQPNDMAQRVASLSPKEAKVYQYLFSKQGTPADAPEILREIWSSAVAFGTVAVYISLLRKKLGRDAVVRKPDGYVLSDFLTTQSSPSEPTPA